MRIQFILPLILIIFSQASQSQTIFDEAKGILGFIHDVKEILPLVQADIEKLDAIEFNSTETMENYINVLKPFKNASIKVLEIEDNHIKQSKQSIYNDITNSPLDLYRFELLIQDLETVSEHFTKMETIESSKNSTLIILFAESIIDKHYLLPNLYNSFYLQLLRLYMPDKDEMNELRRRHKIPTKNICRSRQVPQQLVYSVYKDIALTELKAYILIEYSFLILKVSRQCNFTKSMNKVRLNYQNVSENALDTLKSTMEKADRDIWRCDPEKHVHKVTYDEVTRLLQGYVENEVDLNNDESCSETCSDYQNTTTKGCFNQKFCSQQPQCSGHIYDCQFVDSDLSICQSPDNDTRRYDYIEYEDGQKFGQGENCSRDVNNVESWHRWIFTKCSYCFCLCDEPGPKSDRYFSLRETLSDVMANKVVTGVRFVKKNRIFHLQIQQGQLLPRGAINESSVEWVPIDDFKITDSDVCDGVNYHSLSHQERGIDLDEILCEEEEVVTGLRFRVLNGRLSLITMFRDFDFESGEIFEPQKVNSHWSPYDDRQQLNLDNLDIPTRSTNSSQQMSKSNQYLEFVNSGMEQDAAQTTIPFIDIQDVVSNSPVPLAGIGIYYKSSPGYGGFVAPKIISYDFSPHLGRP
ncbi:uncharacterized protein LOC117576394 isoform X1 [Drosophila albomicans]|uniref:Uncharacterized protein LOC117576394 isoform X1 n=1 Tax=Drosophila albomicans TaxID=7291 RepID=A0A9C6TBD4_DROAB|nr:uncharacterized protein LOC117576394 isoform X1 [Drosophila albomicans]